VRPRGGRFTRRVTRPLRVDHPGAVHHVTARTIPGQPLFVDDFDRTYFLGDLARATERYGVLVHAYCLMGNHWHGLLETPNANLSTALRQVNGVYAQGFNARWSRYGHLFQGRFASRLVEREAHLLALCRYLDRNPVEAGLCRSPEDWRWGSHRAYAGLEPPPRFLHTAWVLSRFGSRRRQARRAYRAFVADVAGAAPPSAIGEIYVGSAEFASRSAPGARVEDVPRRHWQPVPPPLETLLDGELGILTAHRLHGYRLREIAAHLGVHSSTVSRRLRRLEGEVARMQDLTPGMSDLGARL
jgi:putative transposase